MMNLKINEENLTHIIEMFRKIQKGDYHITVSYTSLGGQLPPTDILDSAIAEAEYQISNISDEDIIRSILEYGDICEFYKEDWKISKVLSHFVDQKHSLAEWNENLALFMN